MDIKCYDNHGETIDRYTAVYLDRPEHGGFYEMLAVSDSPTHPCGVCQHTTGMDGEHLGTLTPFSELPADVQQAIKNG